MSTDGRVLRCVFNHDELVRLFTVTTNPKHRALLMTPMRGSGNDGPQSPGRNATHRHSRGSGEGFV